MTEEISDRTGRRKTDMRPFGSTRLYVPNCYSGKFGTRFWYSFLVSTGSIAYLAPTSAPVVGFLVGMATWSVRADKPATRQTWGSRGEERGDTPSKCRTVRNDEGVSRLSPKMRGSSSFQTETCHPGTAHPFAVRYLDCWDA